MIRSSLKPGQVMRQIGLYAAILCSLAACEPVAPDQRPAVGDWAFPGPPVGKPPADDGQLFTLAGSEASFTRSQLHNRFKVADWFPERHPPMPQAVASGRQPDQFACGYCHMPTGEGRPENAALAGLPRDYMVAQMAAFADGTRRSAIAGHRPGENMTRIARNSTRAEWASTADYFASLPFRSIVTVQEAETIPAIERVGFGHRRSGKPNTEPLGARIVELADDFAAFDRRDPATRFTAFVPPGSLARGEALARRPRDASHACAACHGADYAGQGEIPGLAGRSPTYLFRQLYNFRAGTRSGANGAAMRDVARTLSDDDMIALAAWLAANPTSGTR